MCQREIRVFLTFPMHSLKIYCHATSSVFFPSSTLIFNSKTSMYDLSEETLTWCVKTNCSPQQQGDTSSDISVDAFCWCCCAGSSEKPLCPLWLLSAGMIKKATINSYYIKVWLFFKYDLHFEAFLRMTYRATVLLDGVLLSFKYDLHFVAFLWMTYGETVLLDGVLQFVLLFGAAHVKTLLTHVKVKTLKTAVPVRTHTTIIFHYQSVYGHFISPLSGH